MVRRSGQWLMRWIGMKKTLDPGANHAGMVMGGVDIDIVDDESKCLRVMRDLLL
jgi:hypothetical protein